MAIVVLWLSQLAALCAGAASRSAAAAHGGLPRWLRMSLSASLVAAAFLVDASAGPQTAAYTTQARFGMLLSFLGDLLMAKLVPFPNRLVGGMLAFGVAHLMYVRAYTGQMAAAGASFPPLLAAAAVGAYVVFSVAAWRIWIRSPARSTVVNAGALVYGTWIGVMAGCALTLAASLGGAWWAAAAGGAVFVVSDLLIGLTAIGGRHVPDEQLWIWTTYVVGQMGILYAPWLAGLSAAHG